MVMRWRNVNTIISSFFQYVSTKMSQYLYSAYWLYKYRCLKELTMSATEKQDDIWMLKTAENRNPAYGLRSPWK